MGAGLIALCALSIVCSIGLIVIAINRRLNFLIILFASLSILYCGAVGGEAIINTTGNTLTPQTCLGMKLAKRWIVHAIYHNVAAMLFVVWYCLQYYDAKSLLSAKGKLICLLIVLISPVIPIALSVGLLALEVGQQNAAIDTSRSCMIDTDLPSTANYVFLGFALIVNLIGVLFALLSMIKLLRARSKIVSMLEQSNISVSMLCRLFLVGVCYCTLGVSAIVARLLQVGLEQSRSSSPAVYIGASTGIIGLLVFTAGRNDHSRNSGSLSACFYDDADVSDLSGTTAAIMNGRTAVIVDCVPLVNSKIDFASNGSGSERRGSSDTTRTPFTKDDFSIDKLSMNI